MEKFGIWALSGFLNWFWALMWRASRAKSWRKFQGKILITAPLWPNDNMWNRLNCAHFTWEPRATLPPSKAALLWRVWKQCPIHGLWGRVAVVHFLKELHESRAASRWISSREKKGGHCGYFNWQTELTDCDRSYMSHPWTLPEVTERVSLGRRLRIPPKLVGTRAKQVMCWY